MRQEGHLDTSNFELLQKKVGHIREGVRKALFEEKKQTPIIYSRSSDGHSEVLLEKKIYSTLFSRFGHLNQKS